MATQTNSFSLFLAVDGSEYSRIAAELICTLPIAQNSKVIALAVLDTPHTLRRQLLLDALSQIEVCFNKKGIPIETGLLHGHPAYALASFAEERHPDLIVLGAKGLRATLGILLGGIAQQVIEYAHWPVLIVRPPSKPINRILAATDGSESSEYTLNYIAKFPFLSGTEIHLVYVIPPYPERGIDSMPHVMLGGSDSLHPLPIELLEDSETWQKQAEEKANSALVHGKEILTSANLTIIDKLLSGDAATELLKYSSENKIDLIVAGSRGLSQVSGWLLGSVSRKLVHYANCSVLIVRK